MRETLIKHFPQISEEKLEKLIKLKLIFPEWNEKINCISRKDIDNIFINHILHSLSIAKIFNFEVNSIIADIGTGGGFPGIPLAIMFPEAKFDLIDSIGKKITVVSNIANELELTNISPINSRAEKLPSKYDYIISRAVTSFPEFTKIAQHLINKQSKYKNSGIIYLKGGEFSEEVKPFKDIKIYEISTFFDMDFYETKKIIHLPIKKNLNLI